LTAIDHVRSVAITIHTVEEHLFRAQARLYSTSPAFDVMTGAGGYGVFTIRLVGAFICARTATDGNNSVPVAYDIVRIEVQAWGTIA
jgi:hypothetical protein